MMRGDATTSRCNETTRGVAMDGSSGGGGNWQRCQCNDGSEAIAIRALVQVQ